MARKNNKIKDYRILYLIGILIIIVVLVISSNVNKKQGNRMVAQEEKTDEEIADEENQRIIAKLQKMEERDRMEFYFGMFLDNIENDEYQKAYDLLYSEFKQNYFPTLTEFEEYIQKTFSEMSNIEHDNIERNGDVYVLWIYITDALNGKPGERKKMNVVIKENDYNDFVMSFSVI